MSVLTFGSLFAGIGGLDLGLERAGMVCKWQVEIDDYATRVLEKHWPNVRRWRDIATFPPDSYSDGIRHESGGRSGPGGTDTGEPTNNGELWDVDLICGGFPCQDISYAGRGAGLDGERSGLFFEALRVVRQLRPRYVLLENVAALLTRGLDRVHGELAEVGYSSESHCIPAASVGAPHIRDRVFIVAYADRPGREQQRRPVAALAKQQAPKRCGWWKSESSVGRVADGVPERVDRLRGLGNAVVPQVAEYVGREILRHSNLTPGRAVVG